MKKTLHPLEDAVAHLVRLIQVEEHPDDLAAWAVAALAAALDVPVVVGVVDDVEATLDLFKEGVTQAGDPGGTPRA